MIMNPKVIFKKGDFVKANKDGQYFIQVNSGIHLISKKGCKFIVTNTENIVLNIMKVATLHLLNNREFLVNCNDFELDIKKLRKEKLKCIKNI